MLEKAEDKAQIFGLLLRAARSRASYAALLSVHTVGLRGQRALGDEERVEVEGIGELRLPRGVVPAFEEVISTGFPYVGPIATGTPSIDAELERLGGVVPPAAMVLPVLVKSQTIALLVGHRDSQPLPKDEVPDLYPLLTAGGRALERFVASRAGAVAPQPGRRASTAGIEGVSDEVTALRRVIEVYREYESWEELADALRALVRSGMERGDPDEDQQIDLLLELGEVEADHLDRPELALEAWKSALTIDAGDSRILEALERFLVTRERWDELVDLLERRAALADEVSERIGLLLNAAAFSRDRLGDEERAIEAYEKILGWDPSNELAAAKLNELYRARNQWDKLAAMLVDRASLEEDTRLHVAGLEAAAEVYEETRADAGAAFLVWMAVLRREPERAGIVDALERLGPAARAWDELLPECEGLAEELEEKSRPVAARLWQQIGRWNRDYLASPETAAAALDRALKLDPDDHDVAFELAALRRQVGPPADLATALRKSAELEIDPFVRAELLVELAGVLEGQLGRTDEALAVLERAFQGDPASRPAAEALARLQRLRGDWDQVAAVLSRHAEALTDPPRAELAELHRELGEVLAEHLGRPEDAARAFKTALELDARNAAALRGLKHLYRATGQRDAYLEADEAELDADAAPDPARYADIAQEWEARDRLDRAAAAWEKLLALEPKNETAHRGLARVFRQLGRWVALAAACRSHLKVIGSGPERAAVLLDLADVLENGLTDVEGAIRACQEVLTVEGVDHQVALDSLGRMYERIGRWNDALEALERCRGNTDREKADLLQRMGRIHLARGDANSAQAHLEEAIAVDPRNASAHEGLARLRKEQGDWALATHHFGRAAQLGDSPADAVRCLLEAAHIYHLHSGDADKARECLERVLEIDPKNAEAGEILGEILSAGGRWESLWPHLIERVNRIREDADATPDQRREVFTRAARCAVELGNTERALELYDLALAIDPAHLGVLLARADALFRAQSWEQAARAYNSILVQHATSLERSQSAELYRRLAMIQKQLGRAVQAAAFYQKALELDPRHRATLEEMVELHLGRDHGDEAIATLRILAEAVDPAEKPAIVERIGDLYASKLGNTSRAASTYLQVVELDPKNRRVLQKLLDVQSEAGQWKYALDTIGRFVSLEEEPRRRGKYILAAAAIRLERLQDVAGALEEYEKALDAFFHGGAALDAATRTRALEAFQGIDEILTKQKDWKRQERAYRKMVKRLSMEDPLLPTLWHGLGEIYRSRLKDYEAAIVAFETAHKLDPDKNPERVKILGELYALAGHTSEGGEDLVERAGKLVEADPTNPDAYRALGRACIDAGRLDEAWCVCRALVFLKQANPAEEELYRRHQEDERRKAKGVFDDELWALMRDPEEDRVVSAIFGLAWEGPVALRAGPPKSFDLKESEKLKIEDNSRAMSKIFQIAARVLNAPLPLVYVQPERTGRLLLANCIDGKRLAPTVIVGRDLMTGYRDTEIAFAVASTMALLRPSYYLRLALPAIDELEAALGAAQTVAGKQVSVKREIAEVAGAFAAEMQKRLAPPAVDALREVVARLPAGRPDLVRWRNAVDRTARRAALVICGELAAAASMVSSEATQVGGPRPQEKVRELVAFSVSPAYFAARRRLGLAIS
ncbi:MAG TPA: tetratricopeptide repeat protein [Kofleriaceae bacterium]|nr:tetratricopeptide repeat protein [Kofleriaceae bacterium]